ncbi:IS200/IS605 family transposase [Desulfohalobiaceae bacterium Ax17]|jgi:putative transposase|uniref:IS200/IS605 family transposase n=1 Tax=Desulfovulcanus ferrireducens TaxID=2831190 RepID=UPI00207BCC85|nr:IS200/IS605 family transposase [Desulfovulcanus ferrireducens]MBT8763063.1 IS200/IS605 family transposase [Desulfovulcanus ferrireducens]
MKRAHYHAVYDLKYHLVLVTKYRNPVLSDQILKRLKEILVALCDKWDVQLLEFNGEKDHVHLLIDAHPSLELSRFINNIKTVTSRKVRKEFAQELAKYYWKPLLWTRAYFIATTGGAPLEVIKQYIEKQGKKPNSSPPKS